MIDNATASATAKKLLVLTDGTRLRIVYTIAAAGPGTVSDICARVGISLLNVSNHLRILKSAGVLDDQRRGRFIVYSFASGIYQPATSGADFGTLTLGGWRVSLCREPGRARGQGRRSEVR